MRQGVDNNRVRQARGSVFGPRLQRMLLTHATNITCVHVNEGTDTLDCTLGWSIPQSTIIISEYALAS